MYYVSDNIYSLVLNYIEIRAQGFCFVQNRYGVDNVKMNANKEISARNAIHRKYLARDMTTSERTVRRETSSKMSNGADDKLTAAAIRH